MPTFAKLTSVFERLKAIMLAHASRLSVSKDTPTRFCVDTRYPLNDGKPLAFGAIEIDRGRVRYHLMPVCLNPDLLKDASRALTGCMQDKSCFDFDEIDEALFRELAALTKSAYASFKERGFV